MPSFLGHTLVGGTAAKLNRFTPQNRTLLGLSVLCSILPDADILTFSLGIPYESTLGHRGFFHSLLFSIGAGSIATAIYNKSQSTRHWATFPYFTFITASHSLLDALTNGGHGIAFYSPLVTTRYFFPWRPIHVSPLTLSEFFTYSGALVLLSELIFIGIPLLVVLEASKRIRANTQNAPEK